MFMFIRRLIIVIDYKVKDLLLTFEPKLKNRSYKDCGKSSPGNFPISRIVPEKS